MVNEVALSKVIPEIRANKIKGFEDFYLLTYRLVYSDIKNYIDNEEITWGILIDVYVDVWKRAKSMPEAPLIRAWLRIVIKDVIKQKDGIENIIFEFDDLINEDKNIENRALSVLIDIEDKLEIIKNETGREKTSKEAALAKNIFGVLMFCIVVLAVIFIITNVIDIALDLGKIANKSKNLIEKTQPLTVKETSIKETDLVYGWNEDYSNKKYRLADGSFVKEDFVEDAGKVYYFDKEGFLYTGNLKKDAWTFVFNDDGSLGDITINKEKDAGQTLLKMKLEQYGFEQRAGLVLADSIKQDAEWAYYLEVHEAGKKANLIRFRQEDGYMEMLAEGVGGYLLLKNKIWYSKDGEMHSLGKFDQGKKIKSGYSIAEKDGRYALYDTYGEQVSPESGYLQVGLINYRIDKGLIKYIKPAKQSIGNYVFSLNEEAQDNAIYLQDKSIYLAEEGNINAICVVGDYLYYSVSMQEEDSSIKSRIMRINTKDRGREDVSKTFKGIVLNMYYYNNTGNIYMEYFPGTSETHGELAVLTGNHELLKIEDGTGRSQKDSTMLELIMVNEEGIYCYLSTCKLDSSGNIKIVDKKPIKISEINKVDLD